MELQTALQQIKKGNLSPIYLLKGENYYLQSQFLDTLRQQIQCDDMGEIRFDLTEQTIEQVVDEAETISFFTDDKLLIVDHSQNMFQQGMERLMEYLNHPTTGTTIVFLGIDSLDERKKKVKQLKKQIEIISVDELSERELRQYVQRTIQNEGYTIQPKALDHLLLLSDYRLTNVMSELKKIYLYAMDDHHITYSLVDELVSKSLEHSLFGMTDFVVNGQIDKALSFYHDLLLQGEDTIKMIYILGMQFRLLLQVKILMQRHYDQKQMASTLKVHPYRVKLAMQQANRMTMKQLGMIYDQFVEADYAVKTSRLDQKMIMELLLLHLKDI